MEKPDSGLGWFTKRDVSAFLGITVGHFDRLYRPHLDSGDVRMVGKALHFRGPAVLAVWASLKAGGDPDMVGDSPALEDYRRAKAGLAELDLKERQGTLADVTKLKAGLSMLCLAIRSATRTLETQFGREAAGIIDEAISDFETQAAAAFPTEVAE